MYWLIKYGFGWLFRLIWVDQVGGLENLPKKGPVILAANHTSYFDFISMVMVCPRKITFLAAEVFFQKPLSRWLMKSMGQIKVERQAKDKQAVFSGISQVLQAGGVVGIFPEGTRSRSGELQEAFNGVAKIARDNKTPVVPVAIIGAYEVMSPHDKKPRFKKQIKINFLPIMAVEAGESDDNFVHKRLMPSIAKVIGQDYDF